MLERRDTMSETRKTCRGERISDNGRSAVKSARLPAVLGIACAVLLVLTGFGASAQTRPRGAVTTRTPAAMRQVQRAETMYRIETPVRLEETTIKVELSSPEALNGWWQFLRETESEPPGDMIVPKALQALKELGETAVLHSGVCLLSDTEQASVHSSKRLPAQTTRMTGSGKPIAAVQYRDLGRRLSAHLEGIDTQFRICFSYDIELNYIVSEPDSASPAFASFNVEGRARVKNGAALVIPNLDGSSGLLIFLTPRVAK